jgi:hypothetical protein
MDIPETNSERPQQLSSSAADVSGAGANNVEAPKKKRPRPINRRSLETSENRTAVTNVRVDEKAGLSTALLEPLSKSHVENANEQIAVRHKRPSTAADYLLIPAEEEVEKEENPVLFSSTQDFQSDFLANMPSPLRREVQAQFKLANEIKHQKSREIRPELGAYEVDNSRGGTSVHEPIQRAKPAAESSRALTAITTNKRGQPHGPNKHTATEPLRKLGAHAVSRGHRLGPTTGRQVQSE